jgi:hypothetical protein
MDPTTTTDTRAESREDELDLESEGLFDWSLFEAWEGRPADEANPVWLLEG